MVATPELEPASRSIVVATPRSVLVLRRFSGSGFGKPDMHFPSLLVPNEICLACTISLCPRNKQMNNRCAVVGRENVGREIPDWFVQFYVET